VNHALKQTSEHDRFNLKANFGDRIMLSEPFEAPSSCDQKICFRPLDQPQSPLSGFESI
jgi:hypothetical protein